MRGVRVFPLESRFKGFEKIIRNSARKVLRVLDREKSAVHIYLIGDARMRFLNKKFRGQDKTTNILSFKEPKNFPHPETKARPLGEIYLNPLYVKKEARENRTHYSLLITQLLVHGMLHLLGFRHKKKRDRMKMERKEQRIIKLLQCTSPLSTSVHRK